MRILSIVAFFSVALVSCGPSDVDFGSAPGAGIVNNETGTSVAALRSDPDLDGFTAKPPHRVRDQATLSPTGLSCAQLRTAYGLPATGGTGTIAVVDAFDNPRAEQDLNVFSTAFGLPQCTTANGCFEKKKMASKVRVDSGWALEIALDIQWAHCVAPDAKILLVEAKSNSGTDLLAAVDYARNRADVVAVSLSWGGGEFAGETSYNGRFTSPHGAVFFAASGDDGTGVIWPSSSPNVVAVGGTTLVFNPDGTLAAETAWSGSGGGLSLYEPAPAYQTASGLVPNANGKRAVPDVSGNADPASGYSVYMSSSYFGQKGWFKVGGTSGSTPVWAGIRAQGLSTASPMSASLPSGFYPGPSPSTLRDIVSGSNGACGFYCNAAVGYDYVTGLGSSISLTH